jgi:hypothetical protein
MRTILGLLCLGFALPVVAQERPPDIDPNTKIQGGADVRGSSAAAGADTGARPDTPSDDKKESGRPDKSASEKDRPISERKPEDEAKGEVMRPRRF